MSSVERYGVRDLTYSNWHRVASVRRYIEDRDARELTMIDIDGLEYCCYCRRSLGVIEAARDVGQPFKPTIVAQNAARSMGVPALLVYWLPGQSLVGDWPDIERFRVRVIEPFGDRDHLLEPAQFANWLVRLHRRCPCRAGGGAA